MGLLSSSWLNATGTVVVDVDAELSCYFNKSCRLEIVFLVIVNLWVLDGDECTDERFTFLSSLGIEA